jgi:hypothetical protein
VGLPCAFLQGRVRASVAGMPHPPLVSFVVACSPGIGPPPRFSLLQEDTRYTLACVGISPALQQHLRDRYPPTRALVDAVWKGALASIRAAVDARIQRRSTTVAVPVTDVCILPWRGNGFGARARPWGVCMWMCMAVCEGGGVIFAWWLPCLTQPSLFYPWCFRL